MFDHEIASRLRELYPGHPQIHFGKRTGSLLLEALCNERRSTILMPGFICSHLSAMASASGKKVVHIDVDPTTMHMQPEMIKRYFKTHSVSDTCLLIDHSFGYIDYEIVTIKKDYPDLLVIEDCARAFPGFYDQLPAGTAGDWVILSMYKTVMGNDHGGILLSRKNILPDRQPGETSFGSLNEYFSKVKILRFFHDMLKRKTCSLGSEPIVQNHIEYSPEAGQPSYLAAYRYLQELKSKDNLSEQRKQAWEVLSNHLQQQRKLSLVKVNNKTLPSKYFISFTILGLQDLHGFLYKLNTMGYYLFNAWPDPPCYYRSFQKSFIYGYENTQFLARNIIHIPVVNFFNKQYRESFLQYFDSLLAKL